jgi:hypothetical protein
MKQATRYLALASLAALCLGAGSIQAQDQGGQGGSDVQGGQGGGRGGRGGRGNFDPAQMQQRMLEGVRTRLEVKDDSEWKAIEPLVQKVMDLRREQMGSGMRGAFGGMGRGGRGGNAPADQGGTTTNNQTGRSRFGGTPSAEETALSDALNNGSSKDILKEKMTAYRKAKTAKEAELKTAQDNLKKVLNTRQEAAALEMGLVH